MSNDGPMTAVVEYQIRQENTTMEEWLAQWRLRADDARDYEPETTAYEAAVNLEHADQVLVFERYRNGGASLKAHVERPAHATLTETMGARNITRRRVMSTRFDDVENYGWWSRDTDVPFALEGAIVTLLGLHFGDERQCSAFIELSAEYAEFCRESEPDTLLYSGGLAAADVDRELDLLAGDVVLAMAFRDPDAVERHRNDPRHQALGERVRACGIDPQSKFLRRYRCTGLGFLSKP